MEEEREKLEKIYKKLNEEEDSVLRKWNESLIPKTILLFPLIAFVITFLKVNTDKTILDLFHLFQENILYWKDTLTLNLQS